MLFEEDEIKEELKQMCYKCKDFSILDYRGWCKKRKELIYNMPVCKKLKIIVEDRDEKEWTWKSD